MAELTREQFLADVANRRMCVLRDEDGYRHLRFINPDRPGGWFEIITWPGALAMSGDMGSWLFRREWDMFGFFRATRVQPSYWHEKLDAIDRHGAQEFDADVFRADVIALLDNHDLDQAELEDERELLAQALSVYEHQEEMQEVVRYWGDVHSSKVSFEAEDIPSGLVWTHRFLWACHAIVWAIEQYDRRDISCR